MLEGEDNPLYDAILDAYDELQAATYNALTGYYRTAIGCLRTVIEQITIGTYFQCCGTAPEYKEWRSGTARDGFRFGNACDGLINADPLKGLNARFKESLGDSFFNQKGNTNPGGWVRRLHSELSEYAHSRPGYSQADQWESNGPVYASDALDFCLDKFIETSMLGFVLAKLSLPNVTLPKSTVLAFASKIPASSPIIKTACEYCFY